MNRNKTGSSSPILSIIIPTRNRAKYAKYSIQSVLRISSSQLEVVVQDNSDNDDLETFLSSNICDSRMRYNHTWERLDAIENFNKAAEMATGEYVTFLGDDDGVNPEIVASALWANKQDFDALVPTRPAHYNWPDISFRMYGKRFSGMVSIRPFTGKVTFPDAEEEMRKCVKTVGSKYLSSSLPKIYYGIVRRSCIEQVRKMTGTYFPGLSPDLAGAMAVVNFTERICQIDYPLFLPGSSGESGAGWGAMGRHIGRLEDFPHLPQYYVRNWSNLVPRFFSGSTIWGEDIVQALKATGREDILRDFNVPLLHAKCAVFHPENLPIIIQSFCRALKATKRSYTLGTLQFAYAYFHTWGLRARALRLNFFRLASCDGAHTVKGLKNIEEAVKFLTKYLNANGRRLDDYL